MTDTNPSRDRGRPAWLDALADVPIRAWACPLPEHAERRDEVTVLWVDGVAHCTAPGCLLTSVNVRVARCTKYREDLDQPCTGGLFFKPGDGQAQCFECGAWCGSQVADYIDGPSAGTT